MASTHNEARRCTMSRAQSVFLRHEDEVVAMAWNERLKMRMKNMFSRPSLEQTSERCDEEASCVKASRQYRLEAARMPIGNQNSFSRIITCNGFLTRRHRAGLSLGVHPNQKLAMYLHWMFRVNFLFLFVVMCTTFFALVILFSGFIAFAGNLDAECVQIGGANFGSEGAHFADAFALSWTTFSTVGYGSTYPALGYQNSSPTDCFFVNFICSLESLLGVLYSGFCGAILFGKVLRIQSHAQVIFSDPLLVRYGLGVFTESSAAAAAASSQEDGGNSSSEDEIPQRPCPVLEFRIVNRLFNEVGGEIMDASLNVVANINANDADPALKEALERGHGFASGQSGGTSFDNSSDESIDNSFRSGDGSSTMRSISRFLGPLGIVSQRDHQAIDEDPTARLVNKHIFSKMMIEATDHPFFKRVWLARHILDEHSPILKHKVRRQIRRNGGSWPEKLSNPEAIRDSLQFNQILVSLNGVSNISASDVYAQKIYDFVDVNIGFQFVNILYRENDGSLGVDTDLINDVREQNGGGGEHLIIED